MKRTIRKSGEFVKKFISHRSFLVVKKGMLMIFTYRCSAIMWFNTEPKVKSLKDVLYGRFSSRFLFGAATSGYQHESAIHGDRDFALWDLQGIRGPHLSADILKHMDDDINLMKILKLKTYSMTIRSVIVIR